MKRLSNLLLLLTAPVLIAGTGCVRYEKSENVLSPTVAGPIPGVNISAPDPIEPRDNLKIAFGQQPITLRIGNSITSGVRPFKYRIEIATDAAFTNLVFVREGVVPGEGGRTELRLPDPLAPERTYFWRAKAEDGANSSEYSAPAFFIIYTPIVFDKPSLQSPVANAQTPAEAPLLVFRNASRTGPATSVAYEVQVASSQTFGDAAIWSIAEQGGGQTQLSPGPLPAGALFFWRVRAYDTSADPPAVGPFSDVASFRTAAAPAPSPVPIGGSCAAAGSEIGIVTCRRSQFSGFMSHSQIVSFLRGVAQDLNAAGYPFAPYGILRKDGGNNCVGYSCDIICSGQGASQRQWDALSDAEGAQGPSWHQVGTVVVRTCEIQ